MSESIDMPFYVKCVGFYTPPTECIKNVLDRVFALIALVMLLPLLAVIALAIKIDSKGPAIFLQKRVGRNGTLFTIYKFRGMHIDARKKFPHLYSYSYTEDEITNLYFHYRHDPRLTRIGRLLRRTSLDELPNFVNVLLGDMSIVGPRPEIPELVTYYKKAKPIVLSVKPGITSLAKLIGRDDLDFTETLRLDIKYVRTRSLALDIRILCGTAWKIITGRSIGY